jgi:hypothetical protein
VQHTNLIRGVLEVDAAVKKTRDRVTRNNCRSSLGLTREWDNVIEYSDSHARFRLERGGEA